MPQTPPATECITSWQWLLANKSAVNSPSLWVFLNSVLCVFYFCLPRENTHPHSLLNLTLQFCCRGQISMKRQEIFVPAPVLLLTGLKALGLVSGLSVILLHQKWVQIIIPHLPTPGRYLWEAGEIISLRSFEILRRKSYFSPGDTGWTKSESGNTGFIFWLQLCALGQFI